MHPRPSSSSSISTVLPPIHDLLHPNTHQPLVRRHPARKQRKITNKQIIKSHHHIEKRKRERINDKIDQLKVLIPSCNPTSTTTTLLPSVSMQQPLHKLSILQAAIDYIHQLHSQLLEHSSSSSLGLSNHGRHQQ